MSSNALSNEPFTKVQLEAKGSMANAIRDRFFTVYDEAMNNSNPHDQTKISNCWGFPVSRLVFHPVDSPPHSIVGDMTVLIVLLDSVDLIDDFSTKKSVEEMFHYAGKDIFIDRENHGLHPVILKNPTSESDQANAGYLFNFSVLKVTINTTSKTFSLLSSFRFIADVLLALTSLSFISAAARHEFRSAFDAKMHLFRRRSEELPTLDVSLNEYHTEDLTKMRCGHPYDPNNLKLVQARRRAQRLSALFNHSASSEDLVHQKWSLQSLLTSRQECNITPPFFCDYGFNVHAEKSYTNFGCTFLDCGLIIIGEGTMFGPNVDVYTVSHPINSTERQTLMEATAPVFIGKNCWIGGKATIVAGVRIGDNAIIGAGSVVTKDVPENWMVAGNPARPIRYVEDTM